jgi:pyrophosphatase PpaX
MNKINTILFDIDGTILDTTEFIIQSAEHALAQNGYSVPSRAKIAAQVGEGFDDFYLALAGPRARLTQLQADHRAFQKEHFHLSKLYPRSLGTLQALHGRGYRLGAVTTRSKITSVRTLREAGILDLFDTLVSLEDAPEIKPSPIPLLKALTALQGQPKAAAMVGDSHLDVEAGKAAGLKTVRATYGFHVNRLHEPEPDFFIDDIGGLLPIFLEGDPKNLI